MELPIQLASDYYLDNFLKLIDHATKWYSDLLTFEEHQWLSTFASLNKPAQCLLVRLYSRKGSWFRSDKLKYQEIDNIQLTLTELQQAELIDLSPTLSEQELAKNLLTKAEILALNPNVNKSLKKEVLIELLSTNDFNQFEALSFTIIKLNSDHIIDLLLTLFFANTHQDLSQFVLDDLGLHQFENYRLSKTRRFFNNREQVNHLISLNQIAMLYRQSDRADKSNLDKIIRSIPSPVGHEFIDRKREHIINDIARDYERLNEFKIAIFLFEQTTIPPSRERRARIFDKLAQNDSLSDVVTSMLSHPFDISELEVAQRLEQRLKRKQGLKVKKISKPKYNEYHIALDLSEQRVELTAKAYFEQLGWTVFYAENHLLNALLGLALWDAIFAPVEGAFINPYQYRPLDLYHADFVKKRQSIISEALNNILQGHTQFLIDNYHIKAGINNPLVNWAYIEETLLTSALTHIPNNILVQLLELQLSDLKLYRNGMPDLIAFKKGTFEWIEVKGPSDKLQDNQWRWIKEFVRLKVPFSVCYVSAKEPNKTES